jgi:serine protease inhibitor
MSRLFQITLSFSLLLVVAPISFTSNAQNNFAYDMYTAMEKYDNILFSPTCIKTAFALAYEGANSETQGAFEKVFGFEEDNAKFIAEIEHLKNVAEISNSIWILDNYEILESYIATMKSNFNLAPNYTDFENDPKGSADRINAWIEESTNGMIKKMLEPSDVGAFKMALVNAIYFKQDWKYPFDKDLTKEDEFTNSDGTAADIDMMHSLRYCAAYTGLDEKVIELPYEDDKSSMIVILPNEMKNYELNDSVYKALTIRLQYQKVNLELPKFTFETPTFKLKPLLSVLGLGGAFGNNADFSGMRKDKNLKIGTALHKAKIIVDEEGTEAAAVTVIGMVQTTSAPPRRQVIMQMFVDKPFYYFIRDNATNTILFMGRMNEL